MLVTICLAFSGCAVPPPQAPHLSHQDEIALFESVIRYELARLHFPQHQTVYVEALEIFPNEPARPAQVHAVAHRFPNHTIVVTSTKEFPSRLWMQIT
jgi:hypothetical protein